MSSTSKGYNNSIKWIENEIIFFIVWWVYINKKLNLYI